MTSFIKTHNGHSESDNIFVLEYSIVDNNINYNFDVDVSNYGNEIIGIKAKSDEEVNTIDREDVIDEQTQFVCDCSLVRGLGIDVQADTVMSPGEKLEYIKNHIEKFCAKWNLIHSTKD